MNIKHPARSTIIAAFSQPYSIERLICQFRALGRPTTQEYIERVWQAAKESGELPPLERPEEGFDLRHTALVQTLRVG